MSPRPRMREAMRSGWNGSNSSGLSPTPTNLMGLPTVETMESAAPPRASPSVFVRITPERGRTSAKPDADLLAEHFQLRDGCRPGEVSGHEEGVAAPRLQVQRELGRRCGLAGALEADQGNHGGPPVERDLGF